MKQLTGALLVLGIFTFSSTTPAQADQAYSFQPIELQESDFVVYPTQSSDGQVQAVGTSWAPLSISVDGANFISLNVPESEFGGRTDQIDWKQISVSPDGNYVLAASARGNAGGYVYIADTSVEEISLSQFSNLGNANWTGAVFGASTSDVLVIDGVATIWTRPANGENCDTDSCVGSGEDGSNLSNGWDPAGEHPFAAAYVSADRGQTWSERIQLPAFERGVELTVTFQNSKYILRGTTVDADGNALVNFFELRDSRAHPTNSEESRAESWDAQEAVRRQVKSAQEGLVTKLKISGRPNMSEIQNARLGNLTNLTAEGFLDELDQINPSQEVTLEKLQEVAAKWTSIEALMLQERPTIASLMRSGLVTDNFFGRASLLRTIGALPREERDTVEELRSIIEKIVGEKNARKDKLMKRLRKI